MFFMYASIYDDLKLTWYLDPENRIGLYTGDPGYMGDVPSVLNVYDAGEPGRDCLE